jgi:chemotaxis protein methyltransferase CheR
MTGARAEAVEALAGEAFAFDARDFERVRALIHRHAGIALNPSKRSMVYSRLGRRLRTLGLASFGAYLDAVEAGGPAGPEWQEFVNALTTNLTSFFREAHHFPVLAELAIGRAARRDSMRVWCCAASTGEEPYSIAMTLMEAFGSTAPPVAILATDIDTAVLAKAERGVYREEAIERLDAGQRRRYFLAGRNANAGLVRVRDELRALVRFAPLNLIDTHWPIDPAFDAIFCRNVMIYFDKPTQGRLLARLAARLADDGLLFAGHSESLAASRHLFEPLGQTVYRPAQHRLRMAEVA